ncbi:MAG: sensor histidine kinase [Chloroflexi bacterium]|nr:sensor histidine kinase [Chloroflexota bacterium]
MEQVVYEATGAQGLAPPRARPAAARRLFGPLRLLVQRLFGIPLFYKVLIANGLLVALGAVLGTWLALNVVADARGVLRLERVAAMAALATAISLAINVAVLKAALQPLVALGRVVDEVRGGNLRVRAPRALLTDPAIERLSDTLHEIVGALQHHREQLQAMSYQVLQAQEDERKRIARELHDETAQVLTTLLIGLKMLERVKNPGELRRRTAELRELAAQALEEVRNMAVELRPTTLDDLGLVAALESSTEGYAARVHLRVHFEAQGFERRLPPQVELALYRVVQEALTNVARHASAHQVWVTLRQHGREVVASVRDNGVGFDPAATLPRKEAGLGLFGMRERMALIGGQLSIESHPGQGTCISAHVPLDGAAVEP